MRRRELLLEMARAVAPDQIVGVPAQWLLEILEGSGNAGLAIDLRVEDLARLLEKPAGTVRSWLARGEFPGSYKLHGRQWRVPAAGVEAFQKAQRSASPSPEGPRPAARASYKDWRQEMEDAAA